MPAAEANDDTHPEEPGMANVNEINVADNAATAPSADAAAYNNNARNSEVHNDDAMMDLSPYFNTLIDTLYRNNDMQNAAAGGDNSNNSSNAPQLRSMMVSLLWNGVELIANAGRASLGSDQHQGALFAVDTIGGGSDNTAASASSCYLLPPKFAAVYLYAVAQNIVALEEVVLQGQGLAANSAGMVMDVLDGGVCIKQVADIISVTSIAAIFCKSRDIISKTGILPALAHLIESTSSTMTRVEGGIHSIHSLTPFDPEFIQICLLAGQYRYAQSFLQSRPVCNMTLDFPNFRLHPTMYLRYHYYAGLVHIGCDDWNSSLDSFYLCLTIPCQSLSAISIAARKKSLLVECILVEAEELDKNSGSGGGKKKSGRSAVESRVLDVPGAASQVVARYMAKSSNRVGGGDDDMDGGSVLAAPGGADTSEQPTRERGSSRRRMRSAPSNISSDGGDDDGGVGAAGGRKAKNCFQLGRYHELVSTYISGNANHYATLLTEMTGLLRADGNWGLAKRLEGRLVYRAVRQKASVYSVTRMGALQETLQKVCSSLGSTGGEIGIRRIEDLLMGMTACDWDDPLVADPFVAKMDHSINMVSFQDEDPSNHKIANDKLEKDLSNRLASCVKIAERVRQLDIGLTTAPKYQHHAMKQNMLRKGDVQSLQQGQGVADLGHGAMDISSSDWLS